LETCVVGATEPAQFSGPSYLTPNFMEDRKNKLRFSNVR
jgi:hypothetical protein